MTVKVLMLQQPDVSHHTRTSVFIYLLIMNNHSCRRGETQWMEEINTFDMHCVSSCWSSADVKVI